MFLVASAPFAELVGYLVSPDFYKHQLMHTITGCGCAGLECTPFNYLVDWVTGSNNCQGGPLYSLVVPIVLWVMLAVLLIHRSAKKSR
jgi:hypothetical protein